MIKNIGSTPTLCLVFFLALTILNVMHYVAFTVPQALLNRYCRYKTLAD